MAQPRPKGSAMPSAPTLKAMRQLLIKKRRSTSSPTKKRNRTRPRLAARFKGGMEESGNRFSLKPGILPMAVGPSRMPPMTSAMTRGCRILDNG